MTNYNVNKKGSKYALTAISAMLLSFSFCLVLQIYSLLNSEKSINFEEKNLEQIAQILSIEDLQNTLARDRNNYYAAIRLANLYDEAKDFKMANKYYELALKTSGNSNYTLYNYAMFLAKHNFLLMSANLAEQLQSRTKKAFTYKSRIYEAIGDKLTEKKEAEAANKAYQVAYKYAKALENKKYLNNIIEKYATSFVDLADFYIEKDKIDFAISSLKNSISIKETPMALYKMALIQKELDPDLSETYFSKVLKSNPFLINPYIYNSLLSSLIEKYKPVNLSRADFYIMKKNKFEKILSENYVFHNDIDILNSQIVFEEKFLKKEKKSFLIFDIENKSQYLIKDLYVMVEMFFNKQKFVIEKNVTSKRANIEINSILNNVSFLLPDELQAQKDNIVSEMSLKFYARKNKKAPWTLIKIDTVDF